MLHLVGEKPVFFPALLARKMPRKTPRLTMRVRTDDNEGKHQSEGRHES